MVPCPLRSKNQAAEKAEPHRFGFDNIPDQFEAGPEGIPESD